MPRADVECVNVELAWISRATQVALLIRQRKQHGFTITTNLQRTKRGDVFVVLHDLPQTDDVLLVEDRVIVNRENVFRPVLLRRHRFHHALQALPPKHTSRLREVDPKLGANQMNRAHRVRPTHARH